MVPIVVGDGVMAQREKNGLCPNCEAFWEEGQTQCGVCQIIIGVGNYRDEDSFQDPTAFASHHLP